MQNEAQYDLDKKVANISCHCQLKFVHCLLITSTTMNI